MAAPTLVALDIGSSTIRVAVGEPIEDGTVNVFGYSEEPSCGIRKGDVIDFENALTSVKQALHRAEEMANVSIHSVYMLVTGGHVASTVNRGISSIMGPDGEVTESDIDRVSEAARKVNIEEGRKTIHTVNQYFSIDDQGGIINPLGMEGQSLGLKVLVVHGVTNRIRNMAKIVATIPVEIDDSAYSGLCAGLSVLSPEQKESGVLLIDLGGGTTDVLLYAPRYLALAQSLGVGGEHVTNDIAIGLKIPHSQAANLKITRGSAIADHALRGQSLALPASGVFPGQTIKLSNLNMIINARMEETLTMVKHICDREGLIGQIGGGVVLTGGGAQMKDICNLTEKIFNMPVSIGRPRNVSGLEIAVDNPAHASITGLLRYGAMAELNRSKQSLAGMIKQMVLRRK